MCPLRPVGSPKRTPDAPLRSTRDVHLERSYCVPFMPGTAPLRALASLVRHGGRVR